MAERPLVLSKEERRVIAYHEGGHTLVALLTSGADPVHKVTIVPHGQALGATEMVPLDDRHNYARAYLMARLAVGLGGRVAEEQEIGEITTGAENDLKQVTQLVREMVTRWGMSERLGAVFLGREVGLREQHSYSEETAAVLDEEVQQLIGERSSSVQQLLSQHCEELSRIAEALLERETLDAVQLQQVLKATKSNAEPMQEREADLSSRLSKPRNSNSSCWPAHHRMSRDRWQIAPLCATGRFSGCSTTRAFAFPSCVGCG